MNLTIRIYQHKINYILLETKQIKLTIYRPSKCHKLWNWAYRDEDYLNVSGGIHNATTPTNNTYSYVLTPIIRGHHNWCWQPGSLAQPIIWQSEHAQVYKFYIHGRTSKVSVLYIKTNACNYVCKHSTQDNIAGLHKNVTSTKINWVDLLFVCCCIILATWQGAGGVLHGVIQLELISMTKQITK